VPAVRVGAAARGLLAADVGLLIASPYLTATTVDELSEAGPVYDLVPGCGVAVLIATVALAGIAFLPGVRHRIAAVGGVLLASAVWYPSLETPQGDVGAMFAILAVVGLVLVVGVAVGFDGDGGVVVLAGRVLASAAALGQVGVSLINVVDGRAGFPDDQWTERLIFTESLGLEADAARVLVVGDPAELPGEHRSAGGVDYRVVPITGPTIEEARLGVPGTRVSQDLGITPLFNPEATKPG